MYSMKRYFIYLLAILLLIINCGPGEQPITLISPSQICTIVLDLGNYDDAVKASQVIDHNNITLDSLDQAIAIHAYAARELQQYLAKMLELSTQEIPIVDDNDIPDGPIIFIGTPRSGGKREAVYKKLRKRWKKTKSKSPQCFRQDTFWFKESQDFLVLSGRTPTAVLYSVYDFLDRLGVRWISPQASGEIVPKQGGLILQPIARYFTPQMKLRGFLYDYLGEVPASQQLTPEFLTWMGRNRLNLAKYSDSTRYLYNKLGIKTTNGDVELLKMALNPDAPYPYKHKSFENPGATEPDPYPLSSQFTGDRNKDNILSYFEAHPEWYLVSSQEPALCVSQNTFMSEILKQIKDRLSNQWKNIDYLELYNISQLPWCSCNECSNLGNDTNKWLYMLQIVNTEIQKSSTPKKIIGLNDKYTVVPPEQELQGFDYDNIQVFISPHHRCYNHTLYDEKCKVNYNIVESLHSWQNQNSNYENSINVCELYNNRDFQNLPLLFTTVMNLDMPLYHKLGVKGMATENPWVTNGGANNFMNYQLARQAWRQHVDLDSLKIEYIVNQYPGAYQLMQEYYNKIEEAMANIAVWKWDLADQVNHVILDSTAKTLLPLENFADHFTLDETTSNPQTGTNWERTYQLIYEVQYILYEALTGDIPPQTQKRLLELNQQKKYSELMVNLYDNVIRSMTLGQDEPEMKIESLIRLEEIENELKDFTITEPAFGIKNGLEASGIQKAVNQLVMDNQSVINKYKTP